MVSETKNKLNKLFISTFIEWIARFRIDRFWFIFWQYERPTNWHQFLARRHTIDTLQHHSLNFMSSALDHSTTSTPYIHIKSKGIYQPKNLMSNGSSRHDDAAQTQ
jgi:hypothetical protein